MGSQAFVVNARLAAGLSTLLCWFCFVALAAVVLTHQPHNHIALDIRVCYLLGGLAVAASVLGRVGGALGPAWIWATIISGVVLIVFVFVLDHWNFVVGYEMWLERGQPGFGETLP